MRLRISLRSASGKFTRNGRIAVLSLPVSCATLPMAFGPSVRIEAGAAPTLRQAWLPEDRRVEVGIRQALRHQTYAPAVIYWALDLKKPGRSRTQGARLGKYAFT